MANNKIYGEHYMGIPVNPPYQEGTLVRNPHGINRPLKVKNADGDTVPYNTWEKKHFSGTRGRPKKYNSEEERKEARREYGKRAYAKKKEKERQELLNKIKIIGE